MISIIQDDYYCYKRREFYLCGLSSHAGKRDDGVCVILEKKSRKIYLVAIGVQFTSPKCSGMIWNKPILLETLVTPGLQPEGFSICKQRGPLLGNGSLPIANGSWRTNIPASFSPAPKFEVCSICFPDVPCGIEPRPSSVVPCSIKCSVSSPSICRFVSPLL